jgi:hypothetical protein
MSAILYAMQASFTHFLSSGLLGLLVYSSTLTIFRYYYRRDFPLLPKISSITRDAFYIYLFSFLLGCFASLALHLYIDMVIVHFDWGILLH